MCVRDEVPGGACADGWMVVRRRLRKIEPGLLVCSCGSEHMLPAGLGVMKEVRDAQGPSTAWESMHLRLHAPLFLVIAHRTLLCAHLRHDRHTAATTQGVAVLGGIWEVDDPVAVLEQLLHKLHSTTGQ